MKFFQPPPHITHAHTHSWSPHTHYTLVRVAFLTLNRLNFTMLVASPEPLLLCILHLDLHMAGSLLLKSQFRHHLLSKEVTHRNEFTSSVILNQIILFCFSCDIYYYLQLSCSFLLLLLLVYCLCSRECRSHESKVFVCPIHIYIPSLWVPDTW